MKTRSKTRTSRHLITSNRRLVKFPLVKSKMLTEVDFSTSAEDHSITLVFRG